MVDFVSLLPDLPLLNVLNGLSADDLRTCRSVSQAWRARVSALVVHLSNELRYHLSQMLDAWSFWSDEENHGRRTMDNLVQENLRVKYDSLRILAVEKSGEMLVVDDASPTQVFLLSEDFQDKAVLLLHSMPHACTQSHTFDCTLYREWKY